MILLRLDFWTYIIGLGQIGKIHDQTPEIQVFESWKYYGAS